MFQVNAMKGKHKNSENSEAEESGLFQGHRERLVDRS